VPHTQKLINKRIEDNSCIISIIKNNMKIKNMLTNLMFIGTYISLKERKAHIIQMHAKTKVKDYIY
jgi:hypothetical protein